MKKVFLLAVLLATGMLCAAEQVESTIPWKAPNYSLTARAMSLRAALESFGTAQGISVVMSPAVIGTFSGTFKDIPAGEFLDRVATSHNLLWYYDGAALYFYGSGEVQTFLLDLKYMKAAEVRALLRELGVEDARYPIKTASNDELIMVSGPPRYVSLVAETIAKADKLRELRTFNEVEIRVFPLVNTWADDVNFSKGDPESGVTIRGVANLLEDIMVNVSNERVRETSSEDESKETADKAKDGAASKDESTAQDIASTFRPVIRPDNRLNAVVVRDVVTRFPMYEKLIQTLDVPQRLVEIGVTVVELSREDALDWQMSFKVEANQDEISGGIGQNVSNLFDTASMSGKGLAGSVTYLADDFNVSASLSALREKGKARSISRTSLLTLNNLAAQLTDTQSYHARVVGSEVASLEEVSAGTRLQVKPRIVQAKDDKSPNRIWLSLELQDGGFESVTVDAMPMTRTSTLETQASVLETHSILLAGYMRDIKANADWGIPYLRDIPIIGWLFGGYSKKDETVQRLFILTPYIVDIEEPDLARAQATRQRDIQLEEALESDKDVDDLERKEREAQLEERLEIREERAEDRFERNEQERDFRREKRQDTREDEQEDWETDFENRRLLYEIERDATEEAREAAAEAREAAAEADQETAEAAEAVREEDRKAE